MKEIKILCRQDAREHQRHSANVSFCTKFLKTPTQNYDDLLAIEKTIVIDQSIEKNGRDDYKVLEQKRNNKQHLGMQLTKRYFRFNTSLRKMSSLEIFP